MGQSTCLEHSINYLWVNCIHVEEKLNIRSSIASERKVALCLFPILFITAELLLFQVREKVNAYMLSFIRHI